jgi:CheY-like chemotaxis protein
LQEAFDCLVENAIKFTPHGGRVEVQGYMVPGWTCLAVSDTGVGIEPDKLPYLSTSFYQVDGSTTRRYGGLGLGLTLARSVVEEHCGQIEVESLPGQGSRFIVKLPLTSPDNSQDPGGTYTPRILLVDDEENVILTMKAGLKMLLDCEIATAHSGEQALQLFEEKPFDLLITDYKMPGMDGVTLSARIRKAYPRTGIVMITAYGDDDLRERAGRVSIQAILDKPVNLADVRTAALEALSEIRESPSGEMRQGDGQ